MSNQKEYIVCFIDKQGSSDFTDELTLKKAKKFTKNHKENWLKYYITKIYYE